MEKTFYGQPLDCNDIYYTEHHSCPNCDTALIYCECKDGDEFVEELLQLYKEQEEVV